MKHGHIILKRHSNYRQQSN